MTTDDDRIAYLAGEGPGDLDDLERARLDELRGILSSPAVWTAPGDELEDAVVAAIADAAASARFTPRPAPARSPRRSGWLRPWTVIGTAAAAAAVVAVIVVVASDEPEPTEQLAATLEPTSRAPGALGHATFTATGSGWRIDLDASGLDRLAGDRFYQAWLEGDADDLVAIGSFNEGEDVVLWAGVSPLDHPRITVTEEAADGNPAPSGREVLAGVITDP